MHTWSRGGRILNNAYGALNEVGIDETMNIFGGKIFDIWWLNLEQS